MSGLSNTLDIILINIDFPRFSSENIDNVKQSNGIIKVLLIKLLSSSLEI